MLRWRLVGRGLRGVGDRRGGGFVGGEWEAGEGEGGGKFGEEGFECRVEAVEWFI